MKQHHNHYQPPQNYLPHRPPLVLLDKVIDVRETRACCQVRVSPDGVLAPFLTSQGDLPCWYALELMAQTVGVWFGWHQQQRGETAITSGLLLGARELHCQQAHFTAGMLLEIHTHVLIQDGQLGSFEAHITCGTEQLAQGRVNTWQPSQATLKPPASPTPLHNTHNAETHHP